MGKVVGPMGITLPTRAELSIEPRFLGPRCIRDPHNIRGYRNNRMRDSDIVAERSGERRHVTVSLPKLKFMED